MNKQKKCITLNILKLIRLGSESRAKYIFSRIAGLSLESGFVRDFDRILELLEFFIYIKTI